MLTFFNNAEGKTVETGELQKKTITLSATPFNF